MAEKSPELVTREEKIAQAKELYARGYRNYVVGDFNEAAEDLSRSCELNAELFGDESEEVAIPNLFYGKTLIELAQMGENKVLALPDQQEEEEEEDEGGEGESGAGPSANAGENDDDDDDDDDDDSESEVSAPKVENIVNNGAGSSNAGASSSSSSEPQPGTSSGNQNGNGNGEADNGDADANENLQFAWEALEMAAKIFRRLGVGYEEYLAEAHYGLGEILMENQNCTEAIRDYNIAFEMFNKAKPVKERCLAEIKYKTGLCHYTAMSYDTSIADFRQSADYMQQAIEVQKAREQTPEIKQTIEDLTTMREDILNKIGEVEETKQLLRSNLITKGGYGALLAEDVKLDKGAGSSTSTITSTSTSTSEPTEKPKANDISHLIKRKKPDTPVESANTPEASPAKKPAL